MPARTVLIVVACLLSSFLSLAQNPPAAATAPIQKAMDYAASLCSLSVHGDQVLTVSEDGSPREVKAQFDLTLKGKDQLYLNRKTDDSSTLTVSDGKTLILFSQSDNVYAKPASVPARLKLVSAGGDPLVNLGLNFLSRVVHADATLLAETTECTDNGEETITVGTETGVPVHKYTLKTKQVLAELWIATGDKPLLRQYRLDAAPLLAQKFPGQNVSLNITVTLCDWKLNPEVPDTQFAFAPPEDAIRMLNPGEDATEIMVGKPAPKFKLPLLDGTTLDLAAEKGKRVVVLDFWATYCPPCRESLPVLDRLAKDLAPKGVTICAVNGADSEKAKDYAEANQLTLPIGLDKGGKVCLAYYINSIPCTVVIDKEGIVRARREGFGPGSEEELVSKINELLAPPAK